MRYILFIVTSADRTGTEGRPAGYEFSEIADPYLEFVKEGMTVDFASIRGGEPPYVGYDETNEASRTFKEGGGFKRLNFSHKLSEVDVTLYDAIFFPGGLGLMADMVNDEMVKSAIRNIYENDGIIGAVCHGPAALLNVQLTEGRNLLAGKRINSFTKEEEELDHHSLGDVIPFMLEDELVSQGAIFVHGKPFEPFVVNDGNVVTGQNPASAAGVALRMIELMS